jgi:hypothetical protein
MRGEFYCKTGSPVMSVQLRTQSRPRAYWVARHEIRPCVQKVDAGTYLLPHSRNCDFLIVLYVNFV